MHHCGWYFGNTEQKKIDFSVTEWTDTILVRRSEERRTRIVREHHSQRIATTYSSILNLNTSTILPPVGKEYMCFMKEDKSDQADRCNKSRIINKVIDSIISINTFEQQCVVLKGILKSTHLKYHV